MIKNAYYKVSILIFFLITLLISNIYVNKFENQIFTSSSYSYSSIFHEDTILYFSSTDKISEDQANGKNFLTSGDSYKRSFLYPRIIYVFNKFFNDGEIILNNETQEVNFKNYKSFIFIQLFFFYLSILFLHFSLSKLINLKFANITSIVLCINPILMQWHLTMLTESIFLSFLIITFGFLINSKKNIQFFFIGLLIGILYMLRTISLLYPIIFIFFILCLKENILNKTSKFIYLIFGFSIILFLIGSHNYKRAGIFYFTPIQSKTDLQTYLEPSILSKSQNLTQGEISIYFENRKKEILNNNNFDLKSEKGEINFFNEIRNKSFENIYENKLITAKIVLKNYFHSTLLNPVQVYYASKYKDWIDYKNSKHHSFWLKIRIVFTLLFFIFTGLGFLFSFKKIDLKFNVFIIFSCLYFFGVGCWLGNTRYFTPSVLFMNVYFSIFLNQVYLKFSRKIN